MRAAVVPADPQQAGPNGASVPAAGGPGPKPPQSEAVVAVRAYLHTRPDGLQA